MGYTTSKFYLNLIKVFAAKAPGGIVFSADLNEATDEVEGIVNVLGTGTRTRVPGTFSSTATSWTTLTDRLNNIDAGTRSTDVTMHPQYALAAGTALQPTNTSSVALTVTGFTASTADLLRLVAPDASSVLVAAPTQVTIGKSALLNGALTVNPGSVVGAVFTMPAAYTGDTLQVKQSATVTVRITGDGNVFANQATFSKLFMTDYSGANHSHADAATGGQVIPTGTIWMWGGPSTTIPAGWLRCDGSAVSRTVVYAALFAALGTVYGVGDGSTTFNLPNLVSKFPTGASTTASGATGGAATVTLATANLPVHTHALDHDHGSFGTSIENAQHQHKSLGNGQATNLVAHGVGFSYMASTGSGYSLLTDNPNLITGAQDTNHLHTVNPPIFSGASGSAGSATPTTVTPPFVAVHYIVKT